jgi:hypothetical protein
MIRDQGPNRNIGFGVRSQDVGQSRTQGPNPEGGVIARKLHDDPVLRFLGTMAVTIVGMKVGGDLVRKGGLRLGYRLERSSSELAQQGIEVYRRSQRLLDSYQGAVRQAADDTDPNLFHRVDGRIRANTIVNQRADGYFIRQEEIKEARARGMRDPVAMWTMRDEIQQRLVSQARRLPYELPAAYVAQRAITDPVFGNQNPNEKPVNWYNPADVITDFVKQSTINTAAMILPFEAGTAGAQHGWRRFMSYGDEFLTGGAQRNDSNMRLASVGMRAILARMGHDSADILQNAVKFSSQTSGAFATAIQESKKGSMSTVEWMHLTRRGMKKYWRDAELQGLSRTHRGKEMLRSLFSHEGGGSIYDQLPGPLKGLNTGIDTFKHNFREIGRGYDKLNEMMSGQVRYGNLKPSDISALNRVVADGSNIGELSARLANYASKNGDFKQGLFYQQSFQQEYQRQLIRKLQSVHGLSDDGAKQFAKTFSLDPVKGVQRDVHISNRIKVGNKAFHELGDVNDFYNAVYSRTGMFNKTDANIIARNLGTEATAADKMFGNMQFMKDFDDRTLKTWRHIEDVVIPRFGGTLLKRGRLPYEDFKGQLTDAQQSFMVRRTAERLGIPITDPTTGVALPEDMLRRKVRDLGLGSRLMPNDTSRMKGFLMQTGDIAKPWNINGANIFGLKPLEVGVALDRGYFKTGTEPDQNIEALVQKLRNADPISQSIGDYSLGGVYQTPSGKVVDFGSLRRKATRFGDMVAANVQIPLIHLKPLEAAGWSAKRDARQRSILQIVPGLSNQAFLGDANQFGDDAYVWLKTRGAKGKITKVNHTSSGTLESNLLPYEYKLADPDAYKIMGRNLRLGMGESGFAPYVGNEDAKTGFGRLVDSRRPGTTESFKRLFNIDDYQPDSLRGYVSRFRNRRTDLNNPQTMGKLLRHGSLETRQGTMTLGADGAVRMNGNVVRTATQVAEGMDAFTQRIRPFSFADRAIRELEKDPDLHNLFGFQFRDLEKASGIGEGSPFLRISQMKSNAEIVNYARQLQAAIQKDYVDLGEDAARTLGRAERSLLSRHLGAATDASYWDQLLPQGARTSSINTRVDQLKVDMYRFLSIREELVNSGSFDTALPKLIGRLDEMKTNGKITSTEFTEARTALLSMQIDFMNYTTYNAAHSSITNRLGTINTLRTDRTSQGLLDSYLTQNFDTGVNQGRNYAHAFIRRHLKPANYEYDGLEYNPFGYTDTAFVPTFGTAWEREGMGAISSVMGFNTWANPEAFSGASVPMSHVFGRLNKPLQSMGLGMDMTAYKGPVDMYARGLVGQRALPIYAAGVGALTLDRTLGGYVNEEDQNGERVYSPLVLGQLGKLGVEAQSLGAGLIPGGLDYEERREQLYEGEVPVRQGRYWLLGNTPFLGGKIQYYRASWYRRMMAGPTYTDETFGSPLERLAFGYDFSPLRPLAPYHYEEKTYNSRPYPVTGDYFTGPWGPVNPVLNATVGRLLKPERMMHQEELEQGLGTYAMVGDSGLYQAGGLASEDMIGAGYGSPLFAKAASQYSSQSSLNAGRFASAPAPGAGMGNNAALLDAGSVSLGTAAATTASTIGGYNAQLIEAAGQPGSIRPEIISNMTPLTRNSPQYQASEFGYRLQEMAGIYGFAFGATRDYLGFGSQDMSPQAPVLQSGSYAFGTSRGFWDLNIGGAGDLPSPFEGQFANIEFSEVMRRFIPKERTDVDYINPIQNEMGQMHPWLPGAGNITDFTRGDPYAAVREGEVRLPGTAYERLNPLHSDEYGRYGLVDQHNILGDVSPYSAQYKEVDRLLDQQALSAEERAEIETTRAQVAAKSKKYEFRPYKYRYGEADDFGMGETEFQLQQAFERLQHAGTYFNTKFVNHNTAVEDWERNHVYGATFPSWSHPIQDYIEPLFQQNSQRDPLLAGLAMGAVGGMFGASRGAKTVLGTLGALAGVGSAAYIQTKEAITGERHIPESRLKELAAEEQADILSYVKYKKLEQEAYDMGDSMMASMYGRQSRQTMYGADLQNLNPLELVNAVPKRKREHFLEMLQAPEEERDRILSTAPRLERRIYQAAWGYKVEERPDLVDYFSQHELPGPNSEVWHPQTSMGDVEIKIAQSMGLDLAQMGYYPQQISEANRINPEYPDYYQETSERDIRALLREYGVQDYDITPVRTAGRGGSVNMYSGV